MPIAFHGEELFSLAGMQTIVRDVRGHLRDVARLRRARASALPRILRCILSRSVRSWTRPGLRWLVEDSVCGTPEWFLGSWCLHAGVRVCAGPGPAPLRLQGGTRRDASPWRQWPLFLASQIRYAWLVLLGCHAGPWRHLSWEVGTYSLHQRAPAAAQGGYQPPTLT